MSALSRLVNKFLPILILSVALSLLVTATSPSAVKAAGETYKWIDKTKIEGSDGRFGSDLSPLSVTSFTLGVGEFKKSTILVMDSTRPDVSKTTTQQGYAGYIYKYKPGNCILSLGITVNAGNKTGQLVYITPTDPLVLTQGPLCTMPLGTIMDTGINLANSDKANNAETRKELTVKVTSYVPDSEKFPSDTETITITNAANDKVLAEKELGKNKQFKRDGRIGFETEFTVKVKEDNINSVTACSKALGLCDTNDGLAQLLLDPKIGGLLIINLTPDPVESEGSDTSCDIDGIGWIVCPVMNFMAKINDAALSFLGDTFLKITPGFFKEGGDAEAAWKGFRDIANILFVILFLFIIYSQMTGAGISNYGIKRMLPKLIIAAILVNASFLLCRIAIDLSNIVGANISQFFATQLPTGNESNGATYEGLPSWGQTTLAILAGAGVAVVGLALLFAIGLPVLLVLAMIVLILIARKAIIILLVVTSPIAFVAYLLPNTESLFKKWWGLFKAMLFLYPIIGAVFGASVLAAGIINNSANAGSDDDRLLQLTALAVTALPLFAVPLLLKGALAGTGALGAKLSGGLDKANRTATGNIRKGRSGEAIDAFKARRQQKKVNRRLGEGRLATWGSDGRRDKTRRGKVAKWVGTRGAAFDKSKAGSYLGGDRGAAAAVYEQNKLNNESIERSIALLENNGADEVITKAKEQLETAHKRGDAIAARAATRVLASKTGSRGVEELHKSISGIESTYGGLSASIDESVRHEVNGASLKAKDRALDKWSRREPTASGSGKVSSLSGHDIAASTPSSLNESELAGQSVASLRHFAASGTLDATTADRVLAAHKAGTIHLDGDKIDAFTRASDGSALAQSGWVR